MLFKHKRRRQQRKMIARPREIALYIIRNFESNSFVVDWMTDQYDRSFRRYAWTNIGFSYKPVFCYQDIYHHGVWARGLDVEHPKVKERS